MSKYNTDIILLEELLGGSNNIEVVTHCVSRMRFVIKDMALIDDKKIQKLDSCRGTISLANNQYHYVVGPDVSTFFDEFTSKFHICEDDCGSVAKTTKEGDSKFQRILSHFAEIFIPLIPALVAGGLILGIRNIFEADFNGFVLVDKFSFIKGLDEFLWIPAQAVFWFLPVTISWSVFKKMKGSEVLGIILGLSMLLPPLLSTYEVSGAGLKWIWQLDLQKFGFDFGSFHFPWKIAYTGQVIPAIAVAFIGVYTERWLNKVVTPVLRQIFVPLGVILFGYTMAMVIVGPIGWTVGTAVSFAVQWGFSNPILKYVFAPVLGLLYAPLVITGMHHMLNAVMIQNASQIGGSFIFPILAISNICQGAAVLMFMRIHKNKNKTQQIGASAATSAWLGVTEPALYGVNLRYMYPFIGAIIGSCVGALFLTIFGVTSSGIGNGAWLGVLSIQTSSAIKGVHTFLNLGQLWFIVSALIGAITTFVSTKFLSKLKKYQDLENDLGVA